MSITDIKAGINNPYLSVICIASARVISKILLPCVLRLTFFSPFHEANFMSLIDGVNGHTRIL